MTTDWADSMAAELMTLVAFGGQTTETRRAIASRLRHISDDGAIEAMEQLASRFEESFGKTFGASAAGPRTTRIS